MIMMMISKATFPYALRVALLAIAVSCNALSAALFVASDIETAYV